MVVYIELDLIFCWLGISRQKLGLVKTKHKHDSWFFLISSISQYVLLSYWRGETLSALRSDLKYFEELPAVQCSALQSLTGSSRKCIQTMLLRWNSPVSRLLLKPGWQAKAEWWRIWPFLLSKCQEGHVILSLMANTLSLLKATLIMCYEILRRNSYQLLSCEK